MTTPQNLPYGTALTGSNAQAWAEQILSDLGAPQTAADIQSLMDWFAREGGGGANNPLNTTLRTSGASGSINSVGVQSYSSPQTGASADAATIAGGNYPSILADLKSGKGIVGSSDPSVAAELRTWSGGGYSSVSGTPSLGSGTAIDTSGTPASTTSVLGDLTGLSIFQPFANFFTDVTSADIWERIGLILFGFALIGIGLLMLASGPALQALGVSARVGRGARSIGRTFSSSDSGGPTPEEVAERQSRFQLAQKNTEIGERKVAVQEMRERRLDRPSVPKHSGSKEPNPEPQHAV